MKCVGKVRESEKETINCLFEKKSALENLFKIVNSVEMSDLFQKIKYDYENICNKFNQWWEEMEKKYGWESAEDSYWSINFETNEIFLCQLEDI